MNRITEKNLEHLVERINILTKNPIKPYTMQKNGKYKANVGNHHLDWAYGGVQLNIMCNESGGVSHVIYTGFTTKRNLYDQISAFIQGLEHKK